MVAVNIAVPNDEKNVQIPQKWAGDSTLATRKKGSPCRGHGCLCASYYYVSAMSEYAVVRGESHNNCTVESDFCLCRTASEVVLYAHNLGPYY